MAHPETEIQQAEAVVRSAGASQEWKSYQFEEIGFYQGQRVWALTSPAGARYETSVGGCTCPDHRARCASLRIPCKHQVMVRLRREARLAPSRKLIGECAPDYATTLPVVPAVPAVAVAQRELPTWFRSLLA
jgi:hypothetical protein